MNWDKPPNIQDRTEIKISPENMERHLEEYERLREDMVRAAILSRERAEQYRGFLVGCAMLTVDSRLEPPACYSIHTGANYKPEERPAKPGWGKHCAETEAMRSALDREDVFIVGIVNASRENGTGDPNELHLSHDVLHPCENCRGLLRQLMEKGMIRKETKILGVNDEADAREEMTVGEMLERYENGGV